MERILVLIRHAESDWNDVRVSDFNRKLNAKGLTDAPAMGAQLKAKGIIPDCIISSTAIRAAETATLIAEKLGFDPEHIQWEGQMYQASEEVLADIIRECDPDNTIKALFIVAHNPGITFLANRLSTNRLIANMPAAAIVGIKFDATHWRDFDQVPRSCMLFDYP